MFLQVLNLTTVLYCISISHFTILGDNLKKKKKKKTKQKKEYKFCLGIAVPYVTFISFSLNKRDTLLRSL